MNKLKHTIFASVSILAIVSASGTAMAQDKTIAVGQRDGASITSVNAKKIEWNLPSQSLSDALTAWSEIANYGILSRNDLTDGLRTNALYGSHTIFEALEKLLEPSGLKYKIRNDQTLVITASFDAAASSVSGDSAQLTDSDMRQIRVAQTTDSNETESPTSDDEGEERESPDVIIVLGTNIRGVAPDSSPSFVFDREDIDKSGFGTLSEFVESLPQNFGGGSNADVISLPNDRAAVFNTTSGAGVNLRGLGSGSTLVLLNGRRLAPAGTVGDFVDISMIPLSAVERVEVLTDGASAIYGADAIAGVVNFVLRDDYEGAESFVRFGSVTEGDLNEYRAGQTIGANWDSGNALVSYEFYHRDNLGVEDREFSSSALLPTDLLPEQESHNILLSASQEVTDRIKLRGFGVYSQRDAFRVRTVSSGVTNRPSESEQFGGSVGAEIELWGDWRLDMSGGYHELSSFTDTTGAFPFQRQTDSDIWSVNAKADGAVVKLPGGDVKLAVGIDYREESFSTTGGNTVFTTADADRNAISVFSEAFIPLVGSENSRPGIKRLELTAAGRYDDYSDFGSTLNPKFGALWSPVDGFVFRGTYGTSFNPPNLGDTAFSIGSLIVASLPDPFSPTGTSVTLADQRNDPNLGPEDATTWTVGFDYNYDSDSNNLNLAVTLFDIRYKDRIDTPQSTLSTFLVNSAFFADLIDRNPDVALTTAIVADAQAQGRFLDFSFGAWTMPGDEDVLITAGLQNLSKTNTRGLEFNVSYGRDAVFGQLNFGLNGNYLFKQEKAVTSTSLLLDEVDTVFSPVDLRMRGNASWSRDGINANIFVNYTDDYTDNRNILGMGDVSIDSWTTVDLNLSYETGERTGDWWLDNTKFSLSVLNVFDENPPAIAIDTFSLTGFDPANADPLGRFIAFQITKAW